VRGMKGSPGEKGESGPVGQKGAEGYPGPDGQRGNDGGGYDAPVAAKPPSQQYNPASYGESRQRPAAAVESNPYGRFV
uniref:Bindin n=1 Tax=Panagrolaimus sp. PS1159 TaxID=55785 RepID=A0AC35G0A3_9BILA